MNYELADRLRMAGFPQRVNVVPISAEGYRGYCEPIQPEPYQPSLTELIEACGDEFMLTNECGIWEAWSGLVSRSVRMGEAGAKHEVEGKTPEEAVAKLWLALHNGTSS